MKTTSVVPHIYIEHHDSDIQFPKHVNAALSKIRSQPSGQGLLAGLQPHSKLGKTVTIRQSFEHETTAFLTTEQAKVMHVSPSDQATSNAAAVRLATELNSKHANEGARAEIGWNPQTGLRIDDRGVPYEEHLPSQSYLALAHELIHARHIVQGTYAGADGDPLDPTSGRFKEEQRAVGIGEFAQTEPSENSIRTEHGEALRQRYKAGTPEPESPIEF